MSQSGLVFFDKQTTAYEMRISDRSSDVCSSVLPGAERVERDRDDQPRPGAEADRDCQHEQEHRPVDRVADMRERAGGDEPMTGAGARDDAPVPAHRARGPDKKSEARRVGKECVSQCRYRGSPSLSKNTKKYHTK